VTPDMAIFRFQDSLRELTALPTRSHSLHLDVYSGYG